MIRKTIKKVKNALANVRKNLASVSKLEKKALPLFIGALVVIIPVVFLSLRNTQEVEAGWFDDSFNYRKKITFGNTGSEITSDRKVKLDVDTATMITDGKLQSDCADMRFTDVNGSLLDHFIDTDVADCNNASTDFYVKVPLVSAGTNTVYMYYANPSATTAQKPDFFADNSTPTLGQGLKAYWKLDETTTNTCTNGVDDACDSAFNEDGDWISDATYGAGKLGNALALDGSAAYANMTGSITYPATTTISAWFKTSLTDTQQNIYFTDTGTSTNVLILIVRDNKLWGLTDDSPGWTNYDIPGVTEVTDGQWHHAVFVIDGTDLYLYLDGKLEKYQSISVNVGFSATTNHIGFYQAGNEQEFNGEIDDVRIYGKVISPSEVTQMYNNGQGLAIPTPRTFAPTSGPTLDSEAAGPGPVAYWKFDEGYGTVINDETANGYNGNFGVGGSAPAWQSEDLCIDGKCLYFDQVDDDISLSSGPNLGSTYGTISFWMRPTDLVSDEEKTVYSNSDASYKFEKLWSSTGWDFTVETQGCYINSGDIIEDEWQHISLTWDTSSNNEKIYRNGTLLSECNQSISSGSEPLTAIGKRGNSASTPYGGFLDEFKVYPYVRTADQIKADFVKGGGAVHGSSVIFGREDDSYLSEGLVGYWKLDETASPATDSSGNGNNGTWVHSPPSSSGKFGIGLDLDGQNDYIDWGTAHNAVLQEKSWTTSFWINGSDAESDYTFNNRHSGNTDEIRQTVDDSTNTVTSTYDDDTVGAVTVSGTLNPGDGNWHHIVTTINTNTLSLYVDGTLLDTADVSGSGTLSLDDQTVFGTRFLGGDERSLGDFRYYDGKVDEIRLYDRTLSAAEVEKLYRWAPGPIGYWNFDEGTGTSTVYDRSGNGYSGSMNGSMTESDWVAGKFGKALDLDGSNDYIRVTDDDAFTPQGGLSVGAWVKLDTGSDDRVIVSKWDYSSDTEWHLTRRSSINNDFIFEVRHQNSNNSLYVDSSAKSAGVWYHVMGTWNGGLDANDVKLYVNGVQEGTGTESGSFTGLTNTNQDVIIGNQYSSGALNGTRYLDGIIDDVRIYNYARTATQVIEDMNAGHPAPGSPVGSAAIHWKFDEGYGTTVNNSGTLSSTYAEGTKSGSISLTNAGKIGKALDFESSGTDPQVSYGINDGTTLGDLYEKSAVSVCAWVSPESDGESNNGHIWDKTASSPVNFLGVSNESGGAVKLSAGLDLDGSDPSYTSTSTIPIDSWSHVCMTWSDDDDDELSIFINGIYDGSSSNGSGAFVDDESNSGFVGGSFANHFDGEIDEFMLFYSELSPDQIGLLYNKGSSTVLGASGTDSSGNPTWSADNEYCPPGQGSTCTPPVAEWNFDEKQGQYVNDISGNGNQGTLGTNDTAGSDDPVWQHRGNCHDGACLEFDGNNDYVNLGNDLSTNTTGTMEAWVYIDSNDFTTGEIEILFGAADADQGTNHLFALEAKEVSGTIRGRIANVSVTETDYIGYGDTQLSNGWHHFSYTQDGTSQKFYVDGVLQSITVEAGSNSSAWWDDANETQQWTIGASTYNSFAFYYENKMDSVRVFNYARTPAQIAWEYNRGAPVGWWKFDECQGSTVYDNSGNENNGAITEGGAGTNTSIGTCSSGAGNEMWDNGTIGKRNASLDFDGNDEYISIVDDDALDFGTGDFSTSVWVKNSGSAEDEYILVKADVSDGTNQFSIRKLTDDTLRFYIRGATAGVQSWVDTSSKLNDSQWHQITATADNTTQTLNIYFDGQNETIIQGSSWDGTTLTNNDPFYIGTPYSGSELFIGQIDDVRLYNYALNENQIKQIINESAIRFGPETGSP